MDTRKQIKRGAIISYVAIFINIVAALIYTPWMIKEIGQANYGLYALATSFVALFTMDFGISMSLTRYLSKYKAENDSLSMGRILGACYRIYLVIATIVFIALLVIYFNLSNIYAELTPSQLSTFKTLFATVGMFTVISFPAMTQNGILSSHEKFVQLKVCDLIRKFTTIAFVILALSLNWGVEALVCANVFAGLLVIIIKYFLIRKNIPFRAEFSSSCKPYYKQIFSFSVWITIIAVGQQLSYNMAPTVLGIVSGVIAISIFAPASTIEGYFYTFSQAINGLFLPLLSRKVANHAEEEVNGIMLKVGKFQMFVLGLIVTGFICVGKNFMELWLGPEFSSTYLCVILLLLPDLIEYSQSIGHQMIVVKDEIKILAIGFIVFGIITIGLSFLLAACWGALGVSLAICIGGFGKIMVQNYIFKYKLNLDLKGFYWNCILVSSLPILGTVGLFWLMPKVNFGHDVTNLIVESMMVTLIFIFLSKVTVYKNTSLKRLVSLVKN
ncbi:MAG: oligosaccharide flippase family protein [Odoribacter sp.]|nr:oligosaccharide flippase family protein [Odoribacter sp.]